MILLHHNIIVLKSVKYIYHKHIYTTGTHPAISVLDEVLHSENNYQQ